MRFINRDKGRFFLPIRIDINQLAKSWLEYGEFGSDDDSFAPLNAAMATIKQSVPIFEAIIDGMSTSGH